MSYIKQDTIVRLLAMDAYPPSSYYFSFSMFYYREEKRSKISTAQLLSQDFDMVPYLLCRNILAYLHDEYRQLLVSIYLLSTFSAMLYANKIR